MNALTADAWVSDLEVNDESMRAIMFGIAVECQELPALRHIPSETVQLKLGVFFGEFDSRQYGIIEVSPVPAEHTADILALRIGFSPAGYRRLAEAAKDWMARAADGDADAVVGHGEDPVLVQPSGVCPGSGAGVESEGDAA